MSTSRVAPLRPSLKGNPPGFDAERTFWDSGIDTVVGVDEVGRGAWAGPISVGAAVVPRDRRVYKIRDSKMLTEEERESLFARIADWCLAWSVGHAWPEECDEHGMAAAQRLAASRALEGLGIEPGAVLIDGNWDFAGHEETRLLVKGDATSVSIAAASILAKVTRDRLMRADADHFPHWWFDSNKGYPGPRHTASLQWHGPSAIHRRSWVFMDGLMWNGVKRFRRSEPQGVLFD